jgi:hypothetical protein
VKLRAVPMTLAEANEFVANFHRHNKPVPGARFAVGVSDGTELWGVAIVSRPVSRALQVAGGGVAEVVRCCVRDGSPKGSCSFLYGACWRAWRAMGGTRLITYTLQSESGASLRGAGWKVLAELAPRDPAGWQNRPGSAWQAVVGQAKFRWEMTA